MSKKKISKKKRQKEKAFRKKSARKKPITKKTNRVKIKQKEILLAPLVERTIVQPSGPEPKNKLVLEYIIYAAPHLLYEFITTPSGLSEWFSDDVNISGNIYTFIWDGAKQQAEVLNISEGKSIRFRWTDRPSDTYFEFRIEKNELTYELSLIITDFAESAEEKNSLETLWHGQVQRLMKVIGSKV